MGSTRQLPRQSGIQIKIGHIVHMKDLVVSTVTNINVITF
jgi:hypothetical protein